MIQNEKYKKPIITFGLGKTENDFPIGQTVKVSQIEIYNNDEFELGFDGDVVPIYGFEVTPEVLGEVPIAVNIKNLTTGFQIESNTVRALMTLRADSNFITADNGTITADNG
jgi:hypothetical protein